VNCYLKEYNTSGQVIWGSEALRELVSRTSVGGNTQLGKKDKVPL
jgi:hypothetical protein